MASGQNIALVVMSVIGIVVVTFFFLYMFNIIPIPSSSPNDNNTTTTAAALTSSDNIINQFCNMYVNTTGRSCDTIKAKYSSATPQEKLRMVGTMLTWLRTGSESVGGPI